MKALGWIILVALLGGGAYWYFEKQGGAGAKIEYRTATVTKGDITQIVTANGTLNPVVTVNVGSQVSGLITDLFVDHNSKVTNGQLIALLDPATYEARKIQAEGDLLSAKAQLTLAEVNARRAQELLQNKLIPQSDYDTTMAELEQRKATVTVRQANLSSAAVDLARTKIYSPIDGTVINRAVDKGQTVQASFSAPTLFLIANDLAQMEISAMVSEADIGGVETNQDVTFTVEAFPSRTFRGVVSQVRNQPTTNQNVVAYATIVQVRNDDLKLKPGMTANVSITTARKQGVLKISNAALRFTPPKDAFVKTNVIKLASATNVMASAGGAVDDGLPPGIPPEFRKRMLERYDKNGDGKVDEAEKKVMDEERERRRAQGGGRGGGGGGGGFGGGGGGFGGGGPGGPGGPGGGSQRPRELPPYRNVYLVSTNSSTSSPRVELQPVQIHIGITDGLSTEVMEGVSEGAVVATGSIGGAPVTPAGGAQSNPFGGPFQNRGGGRGGGRGG
jgi:HlyD family secretion protein